MIAPLLTYDCQFPGWSIGPTPNEYVPNQLLDAVESLPEPPTKIVVATNQNGSTDFITRGIPDDDSDPGMLTIAEERGYEVVDLPYPPGTTDWAPIATQIHDEDPDLLVNNACSSSTWCSRFPTGRLQTTAQRAIVVVAWIDAFVVTLPWFLLGGDMSGRRPGRAAQRAGDRRRARGGREVFDVASSLIAVVIAIAAIARAAAQAARRHAAPAPRAGADAVDRARRHDAARPRLPRRRGVGARRASSRPSASPG